MARQPAQRTAKTVRDEREAINLQIVALKERAKRLSDELRSLEGPIPDRSGRPAKEAGFTVRPA
jgi:hypothetical protein